MLQLVSHYLVLSSKLPTTCVPMCLLSLTPTSCPYTFPAHCPAGAADGSLKVWDKRKLAADGGGHALFTFNHHTGAVLRAEWSPTAPG